MKTLLLQHGRALAWAWQRLLSAPLNTLLSLMVMGIALTLPTFGYLLLDSLSVLGRSGQTTQEISIFMRQNAEQNLLDGIEMRLRAKGDPWRFVGRDDALKQLESSAELAEVVASLAENPLPDAFIVEPDHLSPEALTALKNEFSAWPGVVHVQLDSAWAKRFDAFLRLGQILLWCSAALFAAGLVAVTFNTIRLQVMARSAEIEVASLFGATDAFIRRPFLYFGALQGLLSAGLAAALVNVALHFIRAPAAELAQLYGASFVVSALDLPLFALLCATGFILGWLGAQLSVSLSLQRAGHAL